MIHNTASSLFIGLAFISFFATPSCAVHRDEHEVCMGHPFSHSAKSAGWIADPSLKAHVSKRVASPIPSFQVNLGAFSPNLNSALLQHSHARG
jgi:hypothetical protein